jgi:hypothetical protein
MPVPGIKTSVWGVKPVLVMRILVTPVAGVNVGITVADATAAAVVTVVTGAVTVGTRVSVVTGTVVRVVVVNTGVAALMASVTGTVVCVVVCADVDAVCVHPVTATSATRRIINPISSFIWSTHELSIIK